MDITPWYTSLPETNHNRGFKIRNHPDRSFYEHHAVFKESYREYLTEEELKQIINTDFITDIFRETRDIFVFCYFTGFAYIDASKLTVDDIVTKNNKKYIIKNRTKTDVPAFVPLLNTPQKIITKYWKKNLRDGKLLPMHACQVTNRYLKEIASLCRIKKSLSTHVGRHTFATLMLSHGVSIESVSKMLGHTDIRTTQIYALFLNEKVIAEVSLVEDILFQTQHCQYKHIY